MAQGCGIKEKGFLILFSYIAKLKPKNKYLSSGVVYYAYGSVRVECESGKAFTASFFIIDFLLLISICLPYSGCHSVKGTTTLMSKTRKYECSVYQREEGQIRGIEGKLCI